MLPSYDFGERASLKKRHLVFILLANALISIVISVAVFQVMHKLQTRAQPLAESQPTVAATLEGLPSPTSLGEEGRGMEPIVHQVQPGDTLFGMALQYSTSVEAIMKVNELSDPNLLQLGQRLIIPRSIPPPTTTSPGATASPSIQELDMPTVKPAATGKKLVEVVAIVLSPEDSAKGEVAILSNPGLPVSLKGWTLSDKEGNAYTFPQIVIPTGGSLAVHTEAGKDTATDLFWGREEAIWQKGVDQATLRDELGRIINTYDVK